MVYSLQAKIRKERGRGNEELRRQGFIPAVIYGKEAEPRNLTLAYMDFSKIYEKAGESNLIDMAVGGEVSIKVLVKDVQYDPRKDTIIHVDFKQINMYEKIHTYIPFNFQGEPPAAKEQGGILVKNIEELEVECLPNDLMSKIDVDLSSLATFNDVIKVKDIKISQGLNVLISPELIVATVTPPRSIRELEKLEEEVKEDVGEVKAVGEAKEGQEEERGQEEAKEKQAGTKSKAAGEKKK